MTMKSIRSLADLVPDEQNANQGTVRGRAFVETSLQKYGAGRSILVDRNGKILAGNKTSEAAYSIGMEGVEVVQTDGRKLVVVQRTDLDLDHDPAARGLALSDNRASEIGLAWNPDVLSMLQDTNPEVVESVFDPHELEEILAKSETVPDFQPVGIEEQGRLDQKKPVTCPECGCEFVPKS